MMSKGHKSPVYPVHASDSRHLAKVLGVVRDNRQTIMTGGNSNENVKVTHSQPLNGKVLTNFGIVTHPISKWQDCEGRFYLFRLLQMLFYRIAMKSTVC